MRPLRRQKGFIMAEASTKTLKELLKDKGLPDSESKKFLTYVDDAKRAESTKEQNKRPVTNNSATELLALATKYHNLGLTIDGINVVITGKSMAMVTFHGYKNKVKATYPSATFDVQLVREGDTFSVAKESGQVMYSHQIANAFADTEIIGAYCVVKIDGNEYFEALNKQDFEEMKKGSKMGYLWGTWASEFWLKSVIKRACKRHFYDIVAEVDKNDNEDYGQVELEQQVPHLDIQAKIQAAKTAADLEKIMDGLTPEDKVRAQPLVEKRLEKIS